ncbi:MAG: VOC family protein [Flavisolibacter sp.]
MQKITPFLWLNGQAEEAMNFYISVFKNSQVTTLTRYAEGMPGPVGTVMTAVFQLEGQEFIALNGGPQYTFSEAISFVVNCDSQEELDHYWEKLSQGGEEGPCGWLKDRFGLSWQIVPSILGSLLKEGGDKAKRVMAALMQMKKLDIKTLQNA